MRAECCQGGSVSLVEIVTALAGMKPFDLLDID